MKQADGKGLSIFYRLLIAFLSAVIIVSGILTVVFYTFSSTYIERYIREDILRQFHAIGRHFEDNFKAVITKDLQLLASNPLLDDYMMSSGLEKEIAAKATGKLFLKTIQYMKSYQGISFVDYTGEEKIRVDRTGELKEYRNLYKSKLFANIESAAPAGIALDGPFENKKRNLSFSAGIHKIDIDVGEFGGAVVIDYALVDFLNYLDSIIILGENHVWVFSSEGHVLKKPPMENISWLPPLNHIKEYSKTPRSFLSQDSLSTYQDFSIIPGEPFIKIATNIPLSLLFQDINTSLYFFSIVFIISLIITTVIAYFLSAYLSQPIVELAHAAARLSKGDLTTQVKVEATGEVKMLVDSFNHMADSLEKSTVSKNYVDNILTYMMDTLIVTSPEGKIIRSNAALHTLLGYEETEIIGWPIEIILGKEPSDDGSMLADVFKNGFIHNIERTYRAKDGRKIHVLFSASLLQSSTDKIEGVVCVAQNISERKHAEESLQIAHDELEQRVEKRTSELKKAHQQLLHAEKLSAIGKLAASFAHEFNNPLFGVLTVLNGILTRATFKKNDAKLVHSAIRECHRMKNLIKDLQDFNRPTSGKIVFMDIHKTIDDMLLLSNKNFEARNIKVEKHYAQDIVQIRAIADQMKQVLLNMFNNAADACERGGIIRVSTEVLDQKIAIQIQDNGIGINPKTMEHIFEPFFTTKPEVKGIGLGMSVSYGIVKRHGGTIDVTSEIDKGSTFTITLPIEGPSDA